MKKEDDIRWAQKASDEARKRSIRLAHQSHIVTVHQAFAGVMPVEEAARESAHYLRNL